MIINDYIVTKYLSEEIIDNHWIFHSIEKGNYLYKTPDPKRREVVSKILLRVKEQLIDFDPQNKKLFSTLFPEWPVTVDKVNVLLVVGCPDPYDAMVRYYDGKQYVVFDLIQLAKYVDLGSDIEGLIKRLITHEIAHICLHNKYPIPISEDYVTLLKYITFDEGFAHILAFSDCIESYDFTGVIDNHYIKSFSKLQKAIKERNGEKQKALMQQSNSGNYWDKFAAISGKLFLASNIDNIINLYNGGIDAFITSMKL
jgi:hypothetical protein